MKRSIISMLSVVVVLSLAAVTQAATLTVAAGETNNFNEVLDVDSISVAATGRLNLQGGALTHTGSGTGSSTMNLNGDVVVTGGDHRFGDRLNGSGSISIIEDGATGFTIRQMNQGFTGQFNFQVAADGGVTTIDSESWVVFEACTLNVDCDALGDDYEGTITLFDCNSILSLFDTGNVTITGISADRGFLTQSTVTDEINLVVTAMPFTGDVTWDGGGDGVNWGDAENWDPAYVPGYLVVGSGAIGNGGSVTVATDYPGNFAYDVTVTNSSTLNIAANLQNVGAMRVGTDGSAATVTQTVGAVASASLTISVAGNAADAVYTLTDGSHDLSGNASVQSNGVLNVDGGSLTAVLSVIVADGAVLRQTGGGVAAGSGMGTGDGFVISSGGLIEISGGTFRNNARISFASGGIFRIIGDEAAVSQHQLAAGNKGTYEFVLDETGVSTLYNTSWGKLAGCNFSIDGSAYTGGAADIVLYSGIFHATGNNALGSDYTVTGLGTEGVDWTITESLTPIHTVTLNIMNPSGTVILVY